MLEKEVCVYEEGDTAVTFLPLWTEKQLRHFTDWCKCGVFSLSNKAKVSQTGCSGTEASMFFQLQL